VFGDDAWVKDFVDKKARAVIIDVDKFDVVSNGCIHLQLLNLCQNRRCLDAPSCHFCHFEKCGFSDPPGCVQERNWKRAHYLGTLSSQVCQHISFQPAFQRLFGRLLSAGALEHQFPRCSRTQKPTLRLSAI